MRTGSGASSGTGMDVQLDLVPLREPSMSPHEVLASESQERMLLVVEPDKLSAVLGIAQMWGVLATPIGTVTAPMLQIADDVVSSAFVNGI